MLEEVILQKKTVNRWKGWGNKKKSLDSSSTVQGNSLYSTDCHIMKTQGWEKKIQMSRKKSLELIFKQV